MSQRSGKQGDTNQQGAAREKSCEETEWNDTISSTGGQESPPVRWPLSCDLEAEREPATQACGERGLQGKAMINTKF